MGQQAAWDDKIPGEVLDVKPLLLTNTATNTALSVTCRTNQNEWVLFQDEGGLGRGATVPPSVAPVARVRVLWLVKCRRGQHPGRWSLNVAGERMAATHVLAGLHSLPEWAILGHRDTAEPHAFRCSRGAPIVGQAPLLVLQVPLYW